MRKERWKKIGGLPNEVSDRGRVRRTEAAGNVEAGHICKAQERPGGYLCVNFRPFVHTLVAEAFLGPRPSQHHVVNHKNGDKKDNRLENLEWVTRSENQDHALRTGLSKARGETHGRAKLTREQVEEIRRRYAGEDGTQTELAEDYGVSQMLISKIVRHEVWTHFESDTDPAPPRGGFPRGTRHWGAKLSEGDIKTIRSRFSSEVETVRELAETFGVTRQTIRDIVRRKTWKHVE